MKYLPGSVTLGWLVSFPALAQDSTVSVAERIEQMTSVISGVMLLIGIALAAVAMFKFKAHAKNPSEHPLSGAVARAVLAAILVASGSVLSPLMKATDPMIGAEHKQARAGQSEQNTDERTFKTGRDPGKKKTGF